MRKSSVFFLALAMLFSCMFVCTISNAQTTCPGMVDVSLTLDNNKVLKLTVEGNYFIKESSARFSGGTLVLTRNADLDLTVAHSEKGLLYVGKTISIMREKIGSDSGGILCGSKYFLGHIIVTASENKFKAINRVPFVQYLYCTTNSAIPDYFPLESIKAQAIATKSRALASFKENSGIYSISDRAELLTYNGFDKNAKNIIKCVNATMNTALFTNSEIVNAQYCTSNGGETANSKTQSNVYAAKLDKYDFLNPNSRTEKLRIVLGDNPSMPSTLYNMLIKEASSQLKCTISKIDAVYSVEAHSPAAENTQRNMKRCLFILRLLSDTGKTYDNVRLDLEFSESFGFINYNLSTFCSETVKKVCTLYHARAGSGIGLSMRGAQQRALSGQNYKEILSFYYPGAELKAIDITSPDSPYIPADTKPAEFVIAAATGDVNFRNGPSSQYDILDVVKKGKTVNVYKQENGWALCVYNGTAGYVSLAYLDFSSDVPTTTPTVKPTASPTVKPTASPTIKPTVSPTVKPTPSETAEAAGRGLVSGDGVNLRSGPSVSYQSLTKLNSGEQLAVFSQTNNFYYVYVPSLNMFGYISMAYVTFFPGQTLAPTPSQTPSPAPTNSQTQTPTPEPTPTHNVSGEKFEFAKGVIKSEVNFRTKPSTTNSVIIEKLAASAEVNIIGKSGSWYYVLANNRTGFVSSEYITVKSQGSLGIREVPSSLTLLATSTTGAVNMRHGPSVSYDIIRKLAAGDKLTVYLVQDGWCLVKQGDDYGFVSQDYVRLA